MSFASGGTESSFQNLVLGTSLDPGWHNIQTPSPWDPLNIYVTYNMLVKVFPLSTVVGKNQFLLMIFEQCLFMVLPIFERWVWKQTWAWSKIDITYRNQKTSWGQPLVAENMNDNFHNCSQKLVIMIFVEEKERDNKRFRSWEWIFGNLWGPFYVDCFKFLWRIKNSIKRFTNLFRQLGSEN